MGVQEVRWDKGGIVRAGDYNCFSVEKKLKPFGNIIFCTLQNSVSRLRVLRRIFGPKRDEVTREWKKLHS